MPKRKVAKSAKLIQTLVFHDGPQLALFMTDAGNYMLALAVADDEFNKFFACEMLDKVFTAYRDGRIDLNFVFRFSVGRRYFIFDWSKVRNREVILRPASRTDIENSDNYPDRGFFEEDHSEEWAFDRVEAVRKKFNIDGRWEASDFSRFYAKMGDVYSFLTLLDDIGSERVTVPEQRAIDDALNEPTWAGGGSYVGFYSDVKKHAKNVRPLRVSGITYNSPGHIEMEGRASVFSDISRSLRIFQSSSAAIGKKYTEINKIFDFEHLKTADKEDDIVNHDLRKNVLDRANSLMSDMGVAGAEKLLRGCRGNVLIYTKIVLSLYRRIRDIDSFQKEGRLTVINDSSELAQVGAIAVEIEQELEPPVQRVFRLD